MVTILCAGPGLGFYIPGILLSKKLQRRKIPTEVLIFEDYLSNDKKSNLNITKEKFHQNFKYALMGQKIARDPTPFLDEGAVTNLLDKWKREERNFFIVLSGFWLTILNQMPLNENYHIDLCHLDADYSTSWSVMKKYHPICNNVWFNNWEHKSINYHLGSMNIPLENRSHRFLIHGGGWGIGSYRDKVSILNQNGFELNIIAYTKEDIKYADDRNNYYLIDPNWTPWNAHPSYPPLIDWRTGRKIEGSLYSPLVELIRNSQAIISKPGAGTLIDSFLTRTPIVFLEPFGEYENKNKLLWEEHNLGVSFEEWKASHFSESIIKNLHLNIKNVISTIPDFSSIYTQKYRTYITL